MYNIIPILNETIDLSPLSSESEGIRLMNTIVQQQTDYSTVYESFRQFKRRLTDLPYINNIENGVVNESLNVMLDILSSSIPTQYFENVKQGLNSSHVALIEKSRQEDFKRIVNICVDYIKALERQADRKTRLWKKFNEWRHTETVNIKNNTPHNISVSEDDIAAVSIAIYNESGKRVAQLPTDETGSWRNKYVGSLDRFTWVISDLDHVVAINALLSKFNIPLLEKVYGNTLTGSAIVVNKDNTAGIRISHDKSAGGGLAVIKGHSVTFRLDRQNIPTYIQGWIELLQGDNT